LQNNLRTFTLHPLQYDIIQWRWHKLGLFSVHSFYKWLDFGGIINSEFDIVWGSKIPFKIKIFTWLVRRQIFLTKDQLLKRCWIADSCCDFYGQFEDIYHLFVSCPTVQIIWIWIANFNNFDF
jgi:zinc-binding in reverse transcriptase